ncbi:ABC transporter substrate-binding protein [Methylobacterium currus]|uniref:ABC transporter substrate-binding protein n=1 Tax=Methylobacterium currus TaxID=2051553 RepID=A0A2R4WME8_9HYPH|nr:extracellular solute-binding protein [Methylobacterium currus]AWB22709.1 ABC transporter substrate-binding protein [Methylobacterium currus]UHC17693.1 extracellular solute-binding protein [Methylobacterium currus]
MSAVLKGMTWSHPRGYDPMVACSALWAERTGVRIAWERRSLQDFESFPVEELARLYDLIVIDHPHVGQITAEGCLLPLDGPGREAELAALEEGTVGPSYRSYAWEGRQWAFPIDAATQVQATVPERLGAPPTTFEAVIDLARRGHVALPLRPPHSLMVFYTLAAHLGQPCGELGRPFVEAEAGREAWERLRELASLIDPGDRGRDPIAVFERMAEGGSPIACAPYIYGYVSYARKGFRPHAIRFTDIPAIGDRGSVGAALGGTGIAVSARTTHPTEAVAFACWIASAEAQRGPYAAAGGQPGHAAAWADSTVNDAAANFYRDTRATLEGSYLRPRHDGYMAFQAAAAERINAGLEACEGAATLVDALQNLWSASLRAQTRS